jgi:hypothetical protein
MQAPKPTIRRPELTEALVRLEAAERMLAHGLVSGDVFPLEECAAQALLLSSQARRLLEAA